MTNQSTASIEINKVKSATDTDEPYGVEVLIDCDPKNPDVGSSEMSWFATEAEQEDAYLKAQEEYLGDNYKNTGRYFVEKADPADEQEEPYEILQIKSDKNLCDMQDNCSGDVFYTDDQWAVTHWCQKHFDEQFENGVFIEKAKI